MGTSIDLASAYSQDGRDREALVEFQRAATLMSSLGRDETQTAIVLYNNWALELDQVGRPLEAEKVYQRVIDISRDNMTENAVSPMVLNNYAKVLSELNNLPLSGNYAESAYEKAVKTGDELVVNQSLLERSRIYLAKHDLQRAETMLAEVEPRLHKDLPPGHYAFAAIPRERALIAVEKHDLPNALRLDDEAISIIQAAVKTGHAGSYVLPNLYVERSAVSMALGNARDAEADASQALEILHATDNSNGISSQLGVAYLAQARALEAEGKSEQARSAASHALAQLQGSLGPDHPDTQSARRLAQ
jgi:tetratricopeptide (TPR) repeat protein